MVFKPVSAYTELAEFLTSTPTPADVAAFQLSAALVTRIESLLAANRTRGLGEDEQTELDEYLRVEHLVRIAKLRAQQRMGHDR